MLSSARRVWSCIIRGLIYPALADVLADVLLGVIMQCVLDLLLPNLASSLMESRLYCGSLDTMSLRHHRGSEPRGIAVRQARLCFNVKECINEISSINRQLHPHGANMAQIGPNGTKSEPMTQIKPNKTQTEPNGNPIGAMEPKLVPMGIHLGSN